ncbi:antitoxin [Methylophilus aquaticus]|uniref:Antitoxin n=1 Tax=Methylophilus aquaticus TaxID=1971610 RepID=A0ABT9JVF2_9PROT|nr:antitoxin [Methylophilus aquaticus]MDP8568537.1 antitoxin [Methylophilus aquaticus]
MSRLTIDINEQQHQTLKAIAALQGKSIKQYALERLFPQADDAQGLADLQNLLLQRLSEANRGDVSTLSITEIVQDEVQASANR